MCLLVLAWQAHPRYRLIVAANRDEYHERPAAPLGVWADEKPGVRIAGGRDLRAGGTWLALDGRGRFGAITNYREPGRSHPEAPSRGGLIPGYLRSSLPPQGYLEALGATAETYAGFNLLLADDRSLWYASNREGAFARALGPGVHGLSNGLLNDPWPKVRRVRQGFLSCLARDEVDPEALLALLADRTQAQKPADLPLTGVDPAWEQTLSSPFVSHPGYGTRSSTVVLQPSADGSPVVVIERRFDAGGDPAGTTRLSLSPQG